MARTLRGAIAHLKIEYVFAGAFVCGCGNYITTHPQSRLNACGLKPEIEGIPNYVWSRANDQGQRNAKSARQN